MATSVSSTHTYSHGSNCIEFIYDDPSKLEVAIETQDLNMRSVIENDMTDYAQLFCNPIVTALYHDGKPKDMEWVKGRIESYVKRWKDKDPYTGLAIFKEDEFAGHIVLGHFGKSGQAELAYALHPKFWQQPQHYGTQAVNVIVQCYAPATKQEGYQLDGEPLKKIWATSHTENGGSNKILARLMKLDHQDMKYNALRNHYVVEL